MKWCAAATVALLAIVNLVGVRVYALAPTGDIAIIEIKPTSSESLVIENITASNVNLQDYLLEYFNKSAPTNFAAPTTTQALPNFILGPNQSFLFTGDAIGTCGASGVANLDISLSDTAGYLEVVKTSGTGGNISYAVQDKVSWISSSSGADIVSVPSATADANAVYYRKLSDGSWSKLEINTTPCNLFVTVSSSSSPTYVQWANGDAAPSVVTQTDSTSSGSIPASDVDLFAPQITELLPNPSSPQSDSEDEFIELYNPNDTDFDLSGFKLQVGLNTLHTYTFNAGTVLPAKSFRAFYSIDTNLSMSNTSGQAKLVDPLGTVIASSDPYSGVKEGQSWAFAGGNWSWSTATPNKENIVVLASTTTKSPSATTGTKTTNINTNASTSSPVSTQKQQNVIHSWTVAAIGIIAILYAGYEYRTDLQNYLYKLREYRKARGDFGWPGKLASNNRIKSRSRRGKNNSGKRSRARIKKR